MKNRALLLLAFVIFCLPIFAQEQVVKPKIGLVLSGGGAKGFAHIGVLKVLEEAGVKIDYIGGTSMGAVVGGLYASGYNAEQCDSIFRVTNFDELINDFIPRSSQSFFKKRNNEIYALVLPFNKLKIGVPGSLSKGMYTQNLFTRITRHVKEIKDFNDLPTPFLCIATNIETGQEIVLNKGNLSRAMSASAAFPSLFAPVEIDGKLLMDGGITNNYPVEEVRKLGADIIIGVDVQDGLFDRTQLTEATKILVQITNLHTIEKTKDNIAKTNIYIKPDIKDYGVISFDKGKEIVLKGEEATFVVYEKLKALTDPMNPYKKPKLKIPSDSIFVKNINMVGLNDFTDDYVKGKLWFKEGEKINYNDLKQGINNLNATQNFSSISYTLDKNQDGDDLNLVLKENETHTYLKFGLHYDDLYKSAVLLNLTQKNMVVKNDVFSADFGLGDNIRFNLDYYIDNGFNISFGFKSQFNQFNRNVAKEISQINLDGKGINTINIDFSDFSNQVYFQSVFAYKFLIGGGFELKFLNINSETLEAINPTIDNSSYISAFGYLKYDSFDNKYFPTKGLSFSSDIQSYLISSKDDQEFSPFSIAKADFNIATRIYKKIVFKFQTDAGFAVGADSVPFFNFVLGGYGFNTVNNFKPFYGYDFLTLAGNSYIRSGGTLDYEIFKKNHINFSANFANIGDDIYSTLDWISFPKYSGYAVGYALETVIGPVEIKQSWSPENNKNFTWVSVGFVF